MLVRDFLDLPSNASPDEFIVRPQSDPADLARKYALTSAIAPRLNGLLSDIQGAVGRNEDIGRFIFGSFGSGKSHFLRIAGMMLANDERLYDNANDARLRELRNEHSWLGKTKILVVPVSMVGADAEVGSFTRSLTTEFDRTLYALGLPTLNAFGTTAAFEAFENRVAATPELFSAFEAQTQYDRSFYDDMRSRAAKPSTGMSEGEAKELAAFARVLSRFLTGGEQAFEPTESEAREQMARHAHAHGFAAVAFTIDEFILWAQGLDVGRYAAAVNALNALVESADVKPVRFIVLAAIQRSIMTVFPEDRSDKPLREQLARVKDRFPELPLEDSNIFEIAEKRVLAPLPEKAAEWRVAVTTAAQRFATGEQSVLVGDEPASALAQLYPFHPALLRVLSDVSQGLQRARSSLYMLYQLITEVRPNLEVGQLVSLGALWDVLFAEAHLNDLTTYGPKNEPNHAANRLLKTYATFERLKPTIDAVKKANAEDTTLLDLVVKSALLAQLSHTPFIDANRGLDAAITVENLFRLNRADIRTINEKSGMLKVERLLAALAQAEPGVVSLEGTGAGARVRVELDAIDLSGLLDVLRPGPLFSTLLAQVKVELGLSSVSGQEGRMSADWRHTPRNGHVRFESFEQFTSSGKNSTLALEPNDEFKLGILLQSEFASNPQSVIDNVRSTLESTRDQSQSWAAAWIPAPLSQDAKEALVLLAKIELFEAKQVDYLGSFRAGEHGLVRQRMGSMRVQAQNTLGDGIKRAYQAGRVITLRKDPGELIVPGNVDLGALAKNFAIQLLDRRYQQHPRFGASPGLAQLNALIAIDRRLTADSKQNVLSGNDLDIVVKIGQPLDIFEPGSGVTNAKQGIYLDKIGEFIVGGERRVSALLDRLAREPYGLGKQVAQALLCVYMGRLGYRATLDGKPIPVANIGDLDPRAELAKGDLPSIDQWNAARQVASLVFGITEVPPARTVGNADGLALKLAEPIARLRASLDLCSRAFDTLRARGAYSGQSAVADRYAKARLEVAALIDRADLIVQVGQLDLERYSSLARSALVDGPQLEQLVNFEYLSNALVGSADLKAKLATTLTIDMTPIGPDIERWLDAAKLWIRKQLEAVQPPTPPLEPPIVADPDEKGLAKRSLVRTIALPLVDQEAREVVEELRALFHDAAPGTLVTIEARIASGNGVPR